MQYKGGEGLIYRSHKRQDGGDIYCREVNDIRGVGFYTFGTVLDFTGASRWLGGFLTFYTLIGASRSPASK